ncbi:hypothetical protein CEXT_258931 [Caerostris extrusa]|uniref:Uncharacterized protein n=1 Tax=Caerostris extrusa TaxID=172846 RepID=A0AAV4TYL7_CAEEX|nr:hypothetical protein CEXT_258931 [Caerostris extrusa]
MRFTNMSMWGFFFSLGKENVLGQFPGDDCCGICFMRGDELSFQRENKTFRKDRCDLLPKTKSESLSLAKKNKLGCMGTHSGRNPISLSRKMGHGLPSEDTKDFQFGWNQVFAVKCHKQ